MTNSLPWKDPPFLGKPSISMGHLYHGYVSHNQMVMWVKHGKAISCLPSPSHHQKYIGAGGINRPFPVMGGKNDICFTHIT
jgi:hypothetical protein